LVNPSFNLFRFQEKRKLKEKRPQAGFNSRDPGKFLKKYGAHPFNK